MTLDEFTQVCSGLYMMGSVALTPTTRFRDNDEFDSLIGFAMLSIIKENFSYDMPVSEFLKCNTTAELYAVANK